MNVNAGSVAKQAAQVQQAMGGATTAVKSMASATSQATTASNTLGQSYNGLTSSLLQRE